MIQAIKRFLCDQERKKFKEQEAQRPVITGRYPNIFQIPCVNYNYLAGSPDVTSPKTYDPDYRMDVFFDNTVQMRVPIIISIHGGGLMTGSKEFNQAMCLEFARKQFLVFAIEYPKIPEHTIDEMLEAVISAIKMIVYSAPHLGGDPENVFLVGDSAGAFLAVYAASIINNAKLAEEFGTQTDLSGLYIKGLGLISGLFYTASRDRYGLFYKAMLYGKDMKNAMVRKYRNPESPEIIDSLPPCIFITSEGDFLKKQSVSFCKALQQKGVYVLLDDYLDATLVHDFPVFQNDRKESGDAIRKICSFFWDCEENNPME